MRALISRIIWWLAQSPKRRQLLELLAHGVEEAVEAQSSGTTCRSLYQMRLARDAAPGCGDDRLDVRAYEVGEDDEILLDLIHKAFSWHPDQQYDALRLAREREDPAWQPGSILLHFEGSAPVGFCWTQVHQVRHDRRGEIKLVGVDPHHRGRGVGRRLLCTALDHLWEQGVTEILLYVDATNLRAVRLYLDLGFVVYQTDRQFGHPPLVVP